MSGPVYHNHSSNSGVIHPGDHESHVLEQVSAASLLLDVYTSCVYIHSKFPSIIHSTPLYILQLLYLNYIIHTKKDRYLPIANIARIMKNALPPDAKIGKDSKEAVQEAVSEFISFVTSEASDKCMQEKRKTINGDDLLWAMSTLGFDTYVEPLKIYLGRYREAVKGDKPEKNGGGGSALNMAGVVPQAGGDTSGGAVVGEGDAGGVVTNRPAKKTKHNE